MAAIIATAQNYWISTSALTITLNALGEANRVQASVASGAQIMCYIRGVDGLDFDEGHNYRRWPLTVSPTFFNTNTHKYLYVVIPRTTAIGTQAMVWFPSQLLDINGCAIDEEGEPAEQVGNPDYYYIWLQGIISSSGASGNTPRTWEQQPQTGTLATDEAVSPTGGFWYQWDAISQTVTFLKDIWMDAASTFRNLILGGKTLTGVAVDDTTSEDSTTDVVTPAYLKTISTNRYIRKDQDDVTPFNLGVEQNFDVGRDVTIGGVLRGNEIQSDNFTGDGMADTGFRLTKDDNTGSSKLTVDNLYVRKKATFEEVEVKKETAIAGNQIYSSAANVILRTDYYDGDGNLMGYSVVQVPWMLKKTPFLLRMLSRASRTGFFGRQRKIRMFLESEDIPKIRRVRCYFLAKDEDREVKNMWRVEEHYPDDYPDVSKRGQLIPGTGNDLARCQTMNLHNSNRSTYIHGMETKLGNIYWWRKLCGVSTDPVMGDDGREYHYFDVMFDYNAEQQYRQQGQPCPWCDLASGDIPAAGDHVVQFGNDMNPDRMNLIAVEVNSSSDAPAHKWYRGIYTFDLSRCWWGGNPRKDMISAASGVEFYGPSFKVQTEYGVAKVPKDRDEVNWNDIAQQRDDYSPYANVRKCYNYDAITHNGCRWLCLVPEGMHWVRPQVWGDPTYALYDDNDQYRHNGNYISNIEYTALTADQKSQCGHIPNYTTAEPGTDAAIWKKIVDKGAKGDDGSGTKMMFTAAMAESATAPTVATYNQYTWYATAASPTEALPCIYNALWRTDAAGTLVQLLSVALYARYGKPGVNGKDGWMITADPANVIITQSLGTNTTSFSTQSVTFSAKKGNVSATIHSVSAPTWVHFTGSKSGNTITVTAPTKDGSNNYYTEGYFLVSINVTDPDTGVLVTFSNFHVPCYANLLGTWKESVEAGVKTVVAEEVDYEYLDGVLVKYGRSYTQTASAAGNYETWSNQSESVSGSKAWMNSHINTADQNISRMEQKTGSRNMLDCASGDGWKNWTNDSAATYNNATQKIEGNNVAIDVYSTPVFLKSGVTYAVSVFAPVVPVLKLFKLNGNPNAKVDDFGNNYAVPLSVSQASGSYQGCNRYAGTLTLGDGYGNDYYVLDVYGNGLQYFYRPQIEVGDSPTDWVPGSITNSSSEIRQTAEEIEAKVNDTGVNINDGTINLYADKVRFFKNKASAAAGDPSKVWIDGEYGSLHAVDGEFEGTVNAKAMYSSVEDLTSDSVCLEDYKFKLSKCLVNTYVVHGTGDPDIILLPSPSDYVGMEIGFFFVSPTTRVPTSANLTTTGNNILVNGSIRSVVNSFSLVSDFTVIKSIKIGNVAYWVVIQGRQ